MSSLLTNSSNDLYLNDFNNIAISFTRLQEIQQLVNCKLQTFFGEVQEDLSEGVDYFGIVFNEFLPLTSKINEIAEKILEVEGVIGINNISNSQQDNIMTIIFDIQTDAGSFIVPDIPILV